MGGKGKHVYTHLSKLLRINNTFAVVACQHIVII
jgi:hypothetical protein